MKKQTDEKAYLHIRYSLELKNELQALAKRQDRSLSGQVVFLLKQAIKQGIKIILIVIPVAMPP